MSLRDYNMCAVLAFYRNNVETGYPQAPVITIVYPTTEQAEAKANELRSRLSADGKILFTVLWVSIGRDARIEQ